MKENYNTLKNAPFLWFVSLGGKEMNIIASSFSQGKAGICLDVVLVLFSKRYNKKWSSYYPKPIVKDVSLLF